MKFSSHWKQNSDKYKDLAQGEKLEEAEDLESFPELQNDLHKINKACHSAYRVKETILYWMEKGKKSSAS
jgi:hypothetical protein